MFSFPSENAYRQVLDGIGMKTRVYGEASLLAEFKLAAGSALPVPTNRPATWSPAGSA